MLVCCVNEVVFQKSILILKIFLWRSVVSISTQVNHTLYFLLLKSELAQRWT